MSAQSITVAERAIARSRDEEFAEFFEAEFPRLGGYCLRLLDDEQLARDVAQEALVRVWSRWRTVSDPHAYVYVIATNLVRAEWRRRGRGRALLHHLTLTHTEAHTESDGTVRDAVERLPSRLREPVLLHYYADLPVAEIARVTRKPVGSIKQRLHQARAELAAMLEDR